MPRDTTLDTPAQQATPIDSKDAPEDRATPTRIEGDADTGRVLVVVNPKSGKGGEGWADDVARVVTDLFGAERVEVAKDTPDLLIERTRKAVEDGIWMVVVSGGDGTIAGVSEQVAGSDTILGIIPGGTFNYFARGLNIPEDIEQSAQVLRSGRPQAIDVGDVNGRIFLNNASLGVYPAILKEREGVYAHWGRSRLAAYWSVIRTMWKMRRPLKLKIEVDGKTLTRRTSVAFVANSAFQLDRFEIGAADELRNGKMALLIAPNVSRFTLMAKAVWLGLGRASAGTDYEVITSDRFVISARRKRQAVARDGERDVLTAPWDVRLRKGALRVMVPNAPA